MAGDLEQEVPEPSLGDQLAETVAPQPARDLDRQLAEFQGSEPANLDRVEKPEGDSAEGEIADDDPLAALDREMHRMAESGQLGEARQLLHHEHVALLDKAAAIEQELVNRNEAFDARVLLHEFRQAVPEASAFDDEQIVGAVFFGDVKFREAFEKRYSMGEEQWDQQKRFAIERFRKAVSRLPDPGASADRAAVTEHMMRGRSGDRPPERPAIPQWDGHNTRSYGDEVEKQFGYRPAGTDQ